MKCSVGIYIHRAEYRYIFEISKSVGKFPRILIREVANRILLDGKKKTRSFCDTIYIYMNDRCNIKFRNKDPLKTKWRRNLESKYSNEI